VSGLTGGILNFMQNLILPIEDYQVKGYRFGQRVWRKKLWPSVHLGDDVVVEAGTPVVAIGDGRVIWSEIRLGSPEHRNWGGMVVVQHRSDANSFYSVYGHMKDVSLEEGSWVKQGDVLGRVAGSNTPENGWWATPHLHFGIYIGPWKTKVLPGYWRPEEWRRTRKKWWCDPQEFINNYNRKLL
jgi:murein DD-endopeptidase MepM/ murein hydrolase activator NlpD